jgi:hypothetical protein
MTDTPPPPDTIGSNPRSAAEVNGLVGLHLRQFATTKAMINQDQDFFAATDLKLAPYYFTPDQETQIKTAYSQLDADLDALDMTFVNRLIGMA